MEYGDLINENVIPSPEHAVLNLGQNPEPTIDVSVNGLSILCLIDKGTSKSLLNICANFHPLNQQVSLVGVSNDVNTAKVTEALQVRIGGQCHKHSFVVSPYSPGSLLGRDQLT